MVALQMWCVNNYKPSLETIRGSFRHEDLQTFVVQSLDKLKR